MTTLPPLTIIPAGAGSGKTYTIHERLTRWVRQGKVRPERIVAVTFTEAAANELRERIRSALLADSKVKMEQVLGLDQAYISTIHGFGLRLVQEYCFEGGWSPRPRLLNEDEGNILIRQTLATTKKADRIMTDLARFGYQSRHVLGSAEDQFRGRLSDMIQKHRVIGIEGVHKEIKKHLLKKIKSLYGRTKKGEILEKNLHTAVKKLLKAFPDSQADLYENNASYRNDMEQDYANLLKAQDIGQLRRNWPLWVSLQTLRISRRGSATPKGYDPLALAVMESANQLHRHPGPLHDALIHAESLVDAAQDCLVQHTLLKRERGLVDYGDMLRLSHELLHDKQDVLSDLSNQVDCVVIDEFQDTNPLQFSLLYALYRKGIPTLVVGDIKQAIMGFQDADSRLLAQLEQADAAVSAPLKNNWRTVRPLMEFLNGAGKGLFRASYQKLTPKVKKKSHLTPLHIINFSKFNKRHGFFGDHVATHIQDILKSKQKILDNGVYRTVRGSDIAILLPTNKMIESYAESFRLAGLPVQVDENGWFESRSVQILYYALLYVADRDDIHAALYLTVTELGQSTLEHGVQTLVNKQPLTDPILEKIAFLHGMSGTQDVSSLVQDVIAVLDIFSVVSTWPEAERERANILRLLAEVEEFTGTNPETLEAGGLYGFGLKTFLAWLVRRIEEDDTLPRVNVVDQDAVQFSTWHSAKGREWPIVAVCGTFKEYKAKIPSLDIQYKDLSRLDIILNKAVIEFSPKFHATETVESFIEPLQAEAEQNARRLLYVAMTRAKEQLILERAGYQEEKEKESYWNLLLDCTGMDIKEKSVKIGKKKVKSSLTTIESEAVEHDDTDLMMGKNSLPRLGLRAIQSRSVPEITMESIRPSQIQGVKPDKTLTVITSRYEKPLDINLAKDPAATGTILHRCFEVLTGTEDRTHLLEGATGHAFTGKQKKKLQSAVAAFETWCCATLGAVELHKEIPITYLNDEGVIVSGIIDLLVETSDGYWIFDHKTHRPKDPEREFLQYWPQLEAYRQGVEGSVAGVGVHWVYGGCVSSVSDVNLLLPNR